MEDMNAHPIEGDEIVVQQVKHDGYNEDNLNLVAKVISDKEFTFRSIKAALMGMRGNPKGVNISDVARNVVLISFQDFGKGFQLWIRSYRQKTRDNYGGGKSMEEENSDKTLP
ncbi:hypothetical protein PIB30_046359 [Stylosanthes scabra]|uniref:Uncharacterized protein n=1 Tax=Stylosanthes scabra TaxID=79078 RepID=A0ABU6YH13_9FABA|nr:hypothetical protein [Stylosanthes scabra]